MSDVNIPSGVPGESRRIRPMAAAQGAINHTKRILFRNPSFGKWFTYGLIIFLTALGGGMGGGGNASLSYNRNFSSMSGEEGFGGADVASALTAIEDYAQENMGLLITGAIALALLLLMVWAVFLWLGSRADMMFIRAVALDDEDLGENWRETQHIAWPLFLFRLVLMLINFVVLSATIPLIYMAIRERVLTGDLDLLSLAMTAAPILAVNVAVGLVMGVVYALLLHFVAPLMYHHQMDCMTAWRVFGAIARTNIAPLLGYFVIIVVYRVVFGFATGIAVCCTLCIAMVPVVNQTVLAPLHVFYRSLGLCALRTLGPEFDMIRPDPETPPPINYEAASPGGAGALP